MTDTKTRRKKEPKIDLNTVVYGKLPPQASDIEEKILGICLQFSSAIEQVSEVLKPEAFYTDTHQKIYRAMLELSQRNQHIEILTVAQKLKEAEQLEEIGGPYELVKKTNTVTSLSGLRDFCLIVQQQFIKREMIRIAGEDIALAYDESTDPFDLMGRHEEQFTKLSLGTTGKAYKRIDQSIVDRLSRIEQLRHRKEYITGVPTGYRDLDTLTYGWQPSDLIILAARPSVGKTAFALNLARKAAMHPEKPVPVGFFSLEMSEGQLTDRMIAAHTKVPLGPIMNARLTDPQMTKLLQEAPGLSQAPIYIDDQGGLNIFEMRAKIRRWRRKHDVGLIIIDYLQLMSGTSETKGNREQAISQISRELKAIAKDVQVPIIALSQLSRKTEERSGENKIPKLSDLRESGAIEQDADVVMFLYREEYYNKAGTTMVDSPQGKTILRFAKHRNGTLDDIYLKAQLEFQLFDNWDESDDLPFPPLPKQKGIDFKSKAAGEKSELEY